MSTIYVLSKDGKPLMPNTKLKVYQKETLLNLMAQSDEEVAALLNEYKELTGSSFQK